MQSILIVDDLESIHEMLDAVIQPIGYHTAFASDGEIALEKFRKSHYDIVLTDIKMKPMDGIELLRNLKEIDPNVVVIIMSGYADIESATQALHLGAFDFLTKPFKVDELMAAVGRAADARSKVADDSGEDEAVQSSILSGDSDSVQTLKEAISRHAKTTTPLLVTGEVGTQKKLIATVIHESRPDYEDAPFITLDAKATDAAELQGQLMNQDGTPGSATLKAKGGSLYLANVDCLSIEFQKQFCNLIRDIKGDVRFICSSQHNLELLVDKGAFDDTLFFRIGSATLHVPSLRDRSEDISYIARSILDASGNEKLNIDDSALNLLRAFHWSGNYAELKEVVKSAAESAADGSLKEQDLPEKLRDIASWPNLEKFLEEQSLIYRRKVLAACLGDTSKAAEILSCDPSNLEGIA